MQSKTLINLEPFNEIYYRNCIQNAYLSIIRYYKKDANIYMANEINYFKFFVKEDIPYLNIKTISIFEEQQIFESLDINRYSHGRTENIVEEVIDNINHGSPVIVFVDAHFLPIRPDTYLKTHVQHSILIYGYIQEEQTFQIIEHNYYESLFFEKNTIKFDDLKKAYTGFYDNFENKEDTRGYITFQNCDSSSKQNESQGVEIWLKNLRNNRMIIHDSFSEIENFRKSIIDFVKCKEDLDKLIFKFRQSVSNITVNKLVERYEIITFIQNEEAVNIINSIISNWNIIYSYAIKYMNMRVYDENIISKINDRMLKIYPLEQSLLKCLLQEVG